MMAFLHYLQHTKMNLGFLAVDLAEQMTAILRYIQHTKMYLPIREGLN
jgi:hypothetical protein